MEIVGIQYEYVFYYSVINCSSRFYKDADGYLACPNEGCTYPESGYVTFGIRFVFNTKMVLIVYRVLSANGN